MNEYRLNQVYSDALTCIASGLTKDETRQALLDTFDLVSDLDAIENQMGVALRDALKQGVEREDIDDSWFAR